MSLIRDGVFGALDIHSLSLAIDEPTSAILAVFLKAKTWHQGRKDVRAYCSKKASEIISSQRLDFLNPISLSRDGFGFLIPSLNEAQLDQYRKAKPEIEGKTVNLKLLTRSVHGRKLLRNLGITKASIPKSDPQADQVMQEYEHYLIELETDTSRTFPSEGPIEQLTLNGKPIMEIEEEEEEKRKPTVQESDGVQAPLSEYMEPSKKVTGKQASRKRSKGRRKKKLEDKK